MTQLYADKFLNYRLFPDDTHTGIGVWPFIIHDPVFEPAAEWHDAAYTKGSWHQKHMTRRAVDEWFLRLMLECATTDCERQRAYAYYIIVRQLGWMFWEGME